jgi:hypothetical protein
LRVSVRGTVLATLAIGLVFSSSTVAHSDDDPLFRSVALASPAGFELGRGFDILYGNPRADCVERTVIQGHPDLGPSSVSFSAVKVENSAQLDRALGVSAAASVSAASWGASGSASFSNSVSVSSYDLTYVVNLKVAGKGDSLRDTTLKTKYLDLLRDGKDSSLARFHEICGDGFVGELTLGGEVQAVIKIHTSSKAEQQSVSASVSASFSLVKASASFSDTLKTLAKTNELQIYMFRQGGSGKVAMSPDELTSTVSTMPDAIKAAPSPIEAVVFSYITVLDDPTLPVADFVVRERTLDRLAALAQSARDQMADAQYIFDNPSQFFSGPDDVTAVAQEISDLEGYIKKVEEQALACVQSAGQCSTLDDPIPAPTARPARK